MKKTLPIVSFFFVLFISVSCQKSDLREDILKLALDQLGIYYWLGGESPSTGFDCSGLIYYCYLEHDITIPRKAIDQYENGEKVSIEEAEPADIVAFHSPVSHVGMLISEDEFIHAPTYFTRIKISSLIGYWGEELAGVVRYIAD